MKQNEINIKKQEDVMWLYNEGFTMHEIGQVKLPQLKGSDGEYHTKITRQRVKQIIDSYKEVSKLTRRKQ